MHPAAEEPRAGPVTLRRWRADDADELYRIVCESLPHLAPWMAWAASGYADTDAREHLTQARAAWAEGVDYDYAITDRVGARPHRPWVSAALTAEAFRIGADRVEIDSPQARLHRGGLPPRAGGDVAGGGRCGPGVAPHAVTGYA